MIPIRPLRKYHDYEGEENGLPLTGVRHYKSVKSKGALQRLRYEQEKKRNRKAKLKQQKAKA